MMQAFVHFLRRSIARKLTLTLVGFVAVTMVVAGLYLNRALAYQNTNYFATGMVNSAPFAMLSGQRCMMLL